MKLALIGYGKMGQAVYNVALNNGHQIIESLMIGRL